MVRIGMFSLLLLTVVAADAMDAQNITELTGYAGWHDSSNVQPWQKEPYLVSMIKEISDIYNRTENVYQLKTLLDQYQAFMKRQHIVVENSAYRALIDRIIAHLQKIIDAAPPAAKIAPKKALATVVPPPPPAEPKRKASKPSRTRSETPPPPPPAEEEIPGPPAYEPEEEMVPMAPLPPVGVAPYKIPSVGIAPPIPSWERRVNTASASDDVPPPPPLEDE